MISHAVLDHCREESTEAGRSGSLPRWLTGRATYNFINCPLGRILYTSGSFEIRYVVVTQDIRLLCFVGKTIRIGLGQNLFHLMASLWRAGFLFFFFFSFFCPYLFIFQYSVFKVFKPKYSAATIYCLLLFSFFFFFWGGGVCTLGFGKSWSFQGSDQALLLLLFSANLYGFVQVRGQIQRSSLLWNVKASFCFKQLP